MRTSIRSRTLRNPASARVSVPGILKPVVPAETPPSTESIAPSATVDEAPDAIHTVHPSLPAPPDALLRSTSSPATQHRYTWLSDLHSTSAFWPTWFKDMSSKFLSARGGKLLILAGTDRLDKELMVGQMQGKFQLVIFPESGHFVQEDQPEKTAQALVEFWKRNDGRLLVLPPKVGEGGFAVGKVAGGEKTGAGRGMGISDGAG